MAFTTGTAYAACLASLLEIPLWMVPPFEQMFGRGGEWRERTALWLKRFFRKELIRTEGHDWEGLPAYYIACGLGGRGMSHAVIYSCGSLVHDPHPDNSGISSVEWCWHLQSLGDTVFPLPSDVRAGSVE